MAQARRENPVVQQGARHERRRRRRPDAPGLPRPTPLEHERDDFAPSWTRRGSRILPLEAQRSQAIDRIDWVIDSLQHMVESGP